MRRSHSPTESHASPTVAASVICSLFAPSQIKRISPQHVHMQSGRKLEADCLTGVTPAQLHVSDVQAQVILKLYGFNGNFDVDRLMTLASSLAVTIEQISCNCPRNVKSMMGFWPDEDTVWLRPAEAFGCPVTKQLNNQTPFRNPRLPGQDFRRYLIAEPIGVQTLGSSWPRLADMRLHASTCTEGERDQLWRHQLLAWRTGVGRALSPEPRGVGGCWGGGGGRDGHVWIVAGFSPG